jgi:hypothetical protein
MSPDRADTGASNVNGVFPKADDLARRCRPIGQWQFFFPHLSLPTMAWKCNGVDASVRYNEINGAMDGQPKSDRQGRFNQLIIVCKKISIVDRTEFRDYGLKRPWYCRK